MYNLPYYKEKDPEVVLQFVKDHPFAFLCGVDENNKPVATQIPVFIDQREGKLFLSGHMMKNTDHHKAFLQNSNVLVLFSGPHTYVSASWYSNKQQGSTWNYQTVHSKGILTFQGKDELINILKRTTAHFENDSNSGANFHDLPNEYVESMVKAIAAFEIEVTEMDHVFKLSQNRDEKSYDNIISRLKEKGGDAEKIGTLMEKRKSKVFPS